MTDRALTRAIRRRLIAVLATLVLHSSVALPSRAAPTVAEMAAEVGLTPDGIAQVEKGEIVDTTPSDRSDRELAIGMGQQISGNHRGE